jgi:hypothetical protein
MRTTQRRGAKTQSTQDVIVSDYPQPLALHQYFVGVVKV